MRSSEAITEQSKVLEHQEIFHLGDCKKWTWTKGAELEIKWFRMIHSVTCSVTVTNTVEVVPTFSDIDIDQTRPRVDQ